jgi:6-phosphogluconolactonase (cycloisomerase 2 family)
MRDRRIALAPRICAIAAAILLHGGAARAACTGDCDSDGRVSIGDLVRGVTVALGLAPRSECAAFADGEPVTIDQLILALNNALDGCRVATATPTATAPAATLTAPATATPSLSVTPTPPVPTSTRSATPSASPSPMDTSTTTRTFAATFTHSATPTRSASPTVTGTATRSSTPTSADPTASMTASTPGAATAAGVARSAQAGTRLSIDMLAWLALFDGVLDAADDSGGCPLGGSVVAPPCDTDGTRSIRTVTYSGCRRLLPSGSELTRSGMLRVEVDNLDYCETGEIGRDATARIVLNDFTLTERRAGAVIGTLGASLTLVRQTGNRIGCDGADATDTWDGELHASCSAGADVVPCPASSESVALTATALRRVRRSTGSPCGTQHTLGGALQVDSGAEPYDVEFEDVHVLEVPMAAGSRRVSIGGRIKAGCLEPIELSTREPLIIGTDQSCPDSGELSFASSTDAAALRTEDQLPPPAVQVMNQSFSAGAAGVAPPSGDLRQRLYRAANGQLYQVVQNRGIGADLGADALRVTTVVASLGSVAECANSAGSGSDPQAVVAAASGTAMPVEAVVKSALLPETVDACFNRNAFGGAGRLCFGTGCTAGCGCPVGSACRVFSALGGIPLTQQGSVPAGQLVPNLPEPDAPCSGFAGRSTYAFGSASPSVQSEQCAPTPTDGFALPRGHTVVFAYRTPPLALATAGVAGFLVDLDGENVVGCTGANRVLNAGEALKHSVAPPRARFIGGDVRFDYDPDPDDDTGVSDKQLDGCAPQIAFGCAMAQPTPDPGQPCDTTPLAGIDEVSVMGNGSGAEDQAGEASCGWSGGGSGSPDRVYEYVAPVTGTYDIGVDDAAGFEPYLYVRADSCAGTETELGGCADDGTTTAKTVHLVAGQRIAIVVDSEDERSGAFSLRVRRRQPDLVVENIAADPAANAGTALAASVEVFNQGDADAGPFSIDFFVSRDDAGAEVITLGTPLRCPMPNGLAAKRRAVCPPENELDIPLVAAGSYFVSAKVDGRGQVVESQEGNNIRSRPLRIDAAPGALLEQRVFRAEDGSVYQLLQAVPQNAATAAASYRITTLSASRAAVVPCGENRGGNPGDPALVAVSTAMPTALGEIRRTGVLRPNHFTAPLFDPRRSGRLTLGAGAAAIELCRSNDECAVQIGEPLELAGDGVPSACITSLVTPPCSGTPILTLAFAGSCSAPTTSTTICAPTPRDGLRLQAGEAVVFAYDPGREPFDVGFGGFGIGAPLSTQPCPGVVETRVERAALPEVPSLRFVRAERGVGDAVMLSPDDRHAYVLGGGTLLVYERSPESGALRLVQRLSEGIAGVRGLAGASTLAFSPSGAHLYIPSALRDTLVVYARDADSGTLSFVDLYQDDEATPALDGVAAVAVSPDGRHVYTVSVVDDAVTRFTRNTITGTLSQGVVRRDGNGGVDGLDGAIGIAISADGHHVYVAGRDEDAVAVFSRSPNGLLTFVQVLRNGIDGVEGLDGVRAITVSRDGDHVYEASETDDAVVAFARDAETGMLTFVELETGGSGNVLNGAAAVTVSRDGTNVYVASRLADTVTVFSRSRSTGSLGQRQFLRDGFNGADGLNGASSVVASADGDHVYVASPEDDVVTIFDRGSLGRLTFAGTVGAVEGLSGASALAVSPDAAHVYVVSIPGDSLAAFARDGDDGTLAFVGAHVDGRAGVDGLNIPQAVAISPDGRQVYVPSFGDDAVAVFDRDASGAVHFSSLVREGEGGVSGLDEPRAMTLSPDGRHAYVASSGAVAAFARDAATGSLQFRSVARQGEAGITGLQSVTALVVAPDGRHLYVASTSEPVAVFERAVETGALGFLGVVQSGSGGADGLAGAQALTSSPDGKHMYVVGHSAIAEFQRDPNGMLTFVQVQRDGIGGVDGLNGANAVAVSADGRRVYVTGEFDDALAVFARDPDSGALSFREVHRDLVDGVDGLESARGVAVSPDGRSVYVVSFVESAVAVFASTE